MVLSVHCKLDLSYSFPHLCTGTCTLFPITLLRSRCKLSRPVVGRVLSFSLAAVLADLDAGIRASNAFGAAPLALHFMPRPWRACGMKYNFRPEVIESKLDCKLKSVNVCARGHIAARAWMEPRRGMWPRLHFSGGGLCEKIQYIALFLLHKRRTPFPI